LNCGKLRDLFGRWVPNGRACSSQRFTIKHFRASAGSDNAVYLAKHERIIEGMRLAGAPEG
jgi:hypothetical protein